MRAPKGTPENPIFDRRGVIAGLSMALPGIASAQAPPPGAANDPRPRFYRRLNQQAAEFRLARHGGGFASLRDYRGQVLILYFGGLWCPDCIADGAFVSRLAADVAPIPGISFLNIHTRNSFGRWGRGTPADIDEAGAEAAIDAYFEETGYSYPVAFDPTRSFARDQYSIEWSPTYLVIDRTGVIRDWRTDLGAPGSRALLASARRFR